MTNHANHPFSPAAIGRTVQILRVAEHIRSRRIGERSGSEFWRQVHDVLTRHRNDPLHSRLKEAVEIAEYAEAMR